MSDAVDMGVELVIVGSFIPIGLVMIANANLSNVNSTVATVFTLVLPILAIVGIVRGWMNKGK
jgi:predicted membrane channel-forming protein YqfA (hemolysin III family)